MSAVESFDYLLANKVSQKIMYRISLPKNFGQLINEYFTDDSFLTLKEDKNFFLEALACLDTFFKAFVLSIQWQKISCYIQAQSSYPNWLIAFQWKWLNPREMFKFLGIPFAF